MREAINIYEWQNYHSFVPEEQRRLQRQNLTETSVCIRPQCPVCFIYTKQIHDLHEWLLMAAGMIRVHDTETVLCDEVYYTTKLEGAKTTRKRTSEIHDGTPVKQGDFSERMVANAFNATKLMNLYGNRLTEDILYQVWDALTEGCRENAEIQGETYRNDFVQIGSFVPPAAEEVPELMRQFLAFYEGEELNDIPFVKAAVIHFAFEAIHPFCDGNGRMGRLLMNNYLIRQGLEAFRAVSVSMAIDRTRSQYDAAFVRSENLYNDCTPFISYLLEICAGECEHILQAQADIELKAPER